ncbi:hypothetical protein L1987_44814 [Smallanthus sonchifolius]|uniref:Uncharacterized protein n=1 Tax=Smallanthus sonchifolius TaxID=185202 RepID=A0ACB9GRS7_9ASTR|nr:hypothetical protein L1987_44814 [Smallanthus sonchifolius]
MNQRNNGPKGGQCTLENCQVLQFLCRQQLIDPRGFVLSCLELMLFRKALTAGVTWIFLYFQPIAMFVEDKILEDVAGNYQIS